jgi:hypothetical protein
MGIFGGGQKQQNTIEPKLDKLNIQAIGLGSVIQICYGTQRVSPILIEYSKFTPVEHVEQQGGGGKGGGGGGSTSTTYTYTANIVLACCEGEILKFGRLWRDKENHPDLNGFTGLKGSYTQEPVSGGVAYRGTAYLYYANYALNSNATLGSHSVEISGCCVAEAGQNSVDAHPADVILDFLTNVHYGVGFPAAKIGDLTQMDVYCKANNLLFSPLLEEKQAAHQYLADFLVIANTGSFWSEGKLKFKPFSTLSATNAFATYTPDMTVVASFTDDDYQDSQDDPVKCTRKRQSDCFNSVTIEHLRRVSNYDSFTTTVRDQANIEVFGLRPKDTLTLKSLCTEAVAQLVANNILDRDVYLKNTFEFTVSWIYDFLEPMDLVAVSDFGLGLNSLVCRVVGIVDNEDGIIALTVENFHATNAPYIYETETIVETVNEVAPVGDINNVVPVDLPVDSGGGS